VFEIYATYNFCAAHKIPLLKKGHKCGRVHGHNYKVTIVCASKKLSVPPFVCDVGEIDKIMHSILKKIDHQLLNDFLDSPTSEMLCKWFFNKIKRHGGVVASKLTKIIVQETDKISATYVCNAE
jgi:6-pyruvoyltetrahydropterin/6-carboxytetrahydropterin synthase